MSDIRDPRWQTASRLLQPRPRTRTGSMATRPATAAEPSESRPYSSMTNAREEAFHNYLKSKDVQRRNETTSAYVSLGQDLVDQKNDPPVYEHSGKPLHSNARHYHLATPISLRHLPTNVYNRNTAQPVFDGQTEASSAFTTRAKGLSRDYTAFDTDLKPRRAGNLELMASCDECAASEVKCSKEHPVCARCLQTHTRCIYGNPRKRKEPVPQQGQEIQPSMEPSPVPKFMSPVMQHDLLPGSSLHEGITGQQRASPVSAMYMSNATPPPPLPPPELTYRCDFPGCYRYFTRGLLERHKERHNGPQSQPSDSPEGSNSNKKQTTTSHTPSYAFQIDEIDERDDRSTKIASEVTSSSAYRFPREKLRYTISEDRTMDARKRHKACFLALKQPTRHTTKAKRHLGQGESNRYLEPWGYPSRSPVSPTTTIAYTWAWNGMYSLDKGSSAGVG